MNTRNFLKSLVAVAATVWLTAAPADQNTSQEIEVWKSPTCGCCQAWVTYMEERGYKTKVHDLDDVNSKKMERGLTDPRLHSCHTAVIDGYVIEGHVPVSDIERLLAQKPDILGLTAPGMPRYSPGMASIEPRDYDVIAVDRDNKTSVFSSY